MRFIAKYFLMSVIVFGMSGAAFAEAFNYTYVNVGYVSFTEDISGVPKDLKGSGYGVTGSIAIHENVAIMMNYSTGSADVTVSGTKISADIDGTLIGGFFHTPISPKADVLFGVGFLQSSADFEINGASAGSDNVDGTLISAGIRAMVANNVEINLFVDQSDIEGESDSDIEIGGAYYFGDQVSLDFTYSFDSDGSAFGIGASKYF